MNQAMRALEIANEVRVANAAWKRENAALRPSQAVARVTSLLRDPVAPYDALPIEQVMRSIPLVGDTKTGRALRRAGITVGAKKVRDLTAYQRECLIGQLDDLHSAWSSRRSLVEVVA